MKNPSICGTISKKGKLEGIDLIISCGKILGPDRPFLPCHIYIGTGALCSRKP